MKLKLNLAIVLVTLLFSCKSSPPPSASFANWYQPWTNFYDPSNAIFLKGDEEPKIIESDDIGNEFFDIRSNYYYCIGETSFNGADEDHTGSIITQCRENGATIALYSKVYTNTRSGVLRSGMSLSEYNIDMYNYLVYYFAAMETLPEFLQFFGADCNNLSSDLQQTTGRNTGAYINIVYTDSPAFHANLQRRDVITRIDEHSINSSDEFYDVLLSYGKGKTVDLEYVRDNQSYETKVTLQ